MKLRKPGFKVCFFKFQLVPLRNGGSVDPEEQGVYMIADGYIPSSTGMNHHQGCDSVQAASPGGAVYTS
jgi:hypothetical protein